MNPRTRLEGFAAVQRGETPLTVGDLRRALENVPDDVTVVLSADGEGNQHSPLAEIADALYVAYNTWSGEARVSDRFIGRDGYTEEDRAPSDAEPVIVLWPTN